MTYTAFVSCRDGWWMIRVPEIDGLTQARLLTDVETMARELIAVTLDIPLDTVAVDVHIAVEEVDRLIELAENVVDIRAAHEARREMEESGAAPIPWETLKAELGLR